MRNKSILTTFILLLGFAFAQNSIVDQFSQAMADIAENANPAVVTITTEKVVKAAATNPFGNSPFEEFFNYHFNTPEREFSQQALGSGVIVDARKGYILTNNHVVDGADEISVQLMDYREVKAKIVGTDPRSDLAVLKINAKNLSALDLGNSDNLRVGEWVMAIGSPFSTELSHTVTTGIVSAMGRSNIFPDTENYEDFIQTDAAINPGNSGGALLNMKGELIGINTAIATGGYDRSNRGVGFAVPSNMVKKVMEDILEYGYVVRSHIGVAIQPVDDAMARAMKLDRRQGALVAEVLENSPAEEAGIEVGDVIIRFEDETITDVAHLRNTVSSTKPGKKVKVEIIRNGKEKVITAVLEEKKDSDLAAINQKGESDQRLGLKVSDMNRELAQRYGIDRGIDGVIVTDVERGSPAARSGLRPGDVIVKVGNKLVSNVTEFRRLTDLEEDESVLLLVKNQNTSRFVALVLD